MDPGCTSSTRPWNAVTASPHLCRTGALKRTHPALHCIGGDVIAPGRKPSYTTARWWLLGGAPSGSTRGTRTPAGALDQEAGRETRLPASRRPIRGVT